MTCRRGHPLDGAHAYTAPDGYRRCRTCDRDRRRSARFTRAATADNVVGIVKPCVENAYGKCWCGATLKTRQDADLHNCDRRLHAVLGRRQIVTGME